MPTPREYRLRRSLWLSVFGALSACTGGIGPSDGGDGATGDAALCMPGGELPSNFFEPPAPPFTSTSSQPLSVQVSVSGEALAQQGYDYTAMPSAGQPVFVDGWEVRFERYLVVVDHVRLSRQGADPSMQDQLGPIVAQAQGPWVIDLHKEGPLTGAGGAPETAVPLWLFTGPDAGGTFDPTIRYAFSYAVVPATSCVRNTNLTSADRDALERMIAHGWTTYFSGTAIYRGRVPSATVDPTFQNYPQRVHFAFGFRAPAEYLNCHNPELGEEDTPANRGIQPDRARAVRAQLTFHTDHSFWDQANVEGTPLHFDPFAARVQRFGMDVMALHELTLDDLAGVNPAALVDRAMMPVMDRGSQTAGYSGMGRLSYRINGAADVMDLRDFFAFNTRAAAHFNSDGQCFVRPTGPLGF